MGAPKRTTPTRAKTTRSNAASASGGFSEPRRGTSIATDGTQAAKSSAPAVCPSTTMSMPGIRGMTVASFKVANGYRQTRVILRYAHTDEGSESSSSPLPSP